MIKYFDSIKEKFLQLLNYVSLKDSSIAKKRRTKYYNNLINIFLLSIIYYIIVEHFTFFENLIFYRIYVFILSYFIIKTIIEFSRSLIISFYRKKNKLRKNYYDSFVLSVDRITNILSFIILAVVFVNILEIDIKTYLASITFLSAAILIVFKDYIVGFLNSLYLMIATPIKVKDYVKVDEISGQIKNIYFLSVEIETDKGYKVIVPTTSILTKDIINYSKETQEKVIYPFIIDRNHYKKIEEIEKEIKKKVYNKFKSIVPSKKLITSLIKEINKDDVTIEVQIKLKNNTEQDNHIKIKQFIYKIILEIINKKK